MLRGTGLLCLSLVAFGCQKAEEPQTAPSPIVLQQPGVQMYPGAKRLSGDPNSKFGEGGFETTASLEKVIGFYMGGHPGASTTGDASQSRVEFSSDGADYTINIRRDKHKGVTTISVIARH